MKVAKTILISRKGFWRKAYTDKRGRNISKTWVPPTKFLIEDRGAKGRGEKVFPKLKEGTLGGPGFFSRSTVTRRRLYAGLAKRIGEKKVVGKLRAIQVFNKRVNPSLAETARRDSRWVASSFKDKRRVPTGKGLS